MDNSIFKRWIDTGRINQEDIIPIILEYDSLYFDGKMTPQDCLTLLQIPFIPVGDFITELLRRIARKKDGQLIELYDKNKQLLRRYWYEMEVSK